MDKKLHILDSGAVALFNQSNSRHNRFCIVKKGQRTGGTKIDYSYCKTTEFWDYVDEYAAFIKEWKGMIDHYVTVDICRNAKLSWKVQQYLVQEHGLRPIPVVHFGTTEKWLEKYLDAGYNYIGLGGRQGRLPYFPWCNRMFNLICNTPNRMPVCKVHGFAITTHRYMVKYPWYSVDSTASKKFAYYGQILVPPKVSGEFSWIKANRVVFIDFISPYTDRGTGKGRHFLHMQKQEQDSIKEWLDFIKVPFGNRKKNGIVTEIGVTNSKQERVAANIRYFLWLESKIPKWPWSWEKPLMRPQLTELLK